MEAMEAMDLDMLVDMEAMEDTGPTTLARGLLILNPRLKPMPGMVAMDMDTEVMVDMVWDTVHMDLDMLVDMEAMDTDVDIASMVEREVTCSKSSRQTDSKIGFLVSTVKLTVLNFFLHILLFP